jgi:hypothetical protein
MSDNNLGELLGIALWANGDKKVGFIRWTGPSPLT